MLVDAIILTGGRSSRLDFTAKSEFAVEQHTLLKRTLDAVSVARRIVIVGPEPATVAPSTERPSTVLYTREDPPFDGPVSGIAAGVTALNQQRLAASDAILILACDMPHIARAIPALLHSLSDNPDSDGAIAVDANGRLQPLAAAYRAASLVSAIDTRQSVGPLSAMPVFRLIDGLRLTAVTVPEGATADFDSWDDAKRLGARAPELSTTHEGEPYE